MLGKSSPFIMTEKKLESNDSTQCSRYTLGSKKDVVVASINVKSFPCHLDEIKILLKEHGLRTLVPNDTKIGQNSSIDFLELE